MSFFQISSHELRNGSERLNGLVQRFNTERETLSAVELELKSMWQGEANETFHRSYLRSMSQMEAFSNLIRDYSRAMNSIADRYDAAETKNLSIASNYI